MQFFKSKTEDPNKSEVKSGDLTYLEKLKFDPELKKSWFYFFIKNFRVVILLILLLAGWGIFSFIQLPLESSPEVKIPVALITTSYPGASPADVEELVTKKVETNISGISGVDKITSYSSNSFSSAIVQFYADQDVDDSIRRLRDKLADIKNDLPEDANDPVLTEISLDDSPIANFSLTGPYDSFTMRGFAEDIQDELEKIPGVREVSVSGGDQKEFLVSYDPQKLTFYGTTVTAANQKIAATNSTIPAGNFEGTKFNYPVRADAKFFDIESLRNIPILHTGNGGMVYLKDIAEVKETAIEKTVISRLSAEGSAPQDAITIQIVKRTGSSILDIVDESKKVTEDMLKTFPSGIIYSVTLNQADQINQDFNQLIHDFILTLMLVIGVLILIVGLKEAFIAGLAIPLVFFITFGVMQITGISLNFLSIFSLLLSLGLLVDDAIVVVSATKQYMKTGKYTPEEAVLLVLKDFKVVLLTTTLATVWAFLPLLLASGIIGEFIKSIPITVSVTLIASLLVALVINIPLASVLERLRLTKKFFVSVIVALVAVGVFSITRHAVWGYIFSAIFFAVIVLMLLWYFRNGKNVLEKNKQLADEEQEDEELIKYKLRTQGDRESATLKSRIMHGVIHFDRILPVYEKYLRMILATKKRRLTVIFGILAIFILACLLPATGILKSEFFPTSNMDSISIGIRGPSGLTLSEMDPITKKVEEKLLKYPEIVNFSTLVGNPGTIASFTSGTSSNTASISIKLTPTTDKSRITSYDLADKIRDDVADIQGATITISTPKGGPTSGSAFQAQVAGDDLQMLDKIANDLKPILDSIPGVINSDISLKDAPAEYTFKLDPVKMEFYDLTAASVGSALRMAISGTEVTTIILNNKDIDVVADFKADKIPTLESIQNLQILNNAGKPVYIKDVAKIELLPSVVSISRINQKRTVLLTSDVSGKTNATEFLAEFQKKLAEKYTLPDGYEITYGGENEQSTESVKSIMLAMIIAFILIFSTMVVQFNSFRKAAIVLVTLPLALIGVFIGMTVFGISLSFPGLVGILALFGIVVKNAIILIDKINLNIKIGIPFQESVIDAGKSRLEAIFITSICTIMGLIPITLSSELWRALGSVVIFGLLLSSFLTLFVVPVLFTTFVKERDKRE
ncbi:MAG TPA: efflux RND transporter permease subunit [Candidatus Moranbacteria bacterium]|nr:efflux RND transporter permease subunit [Candidatus Moranbacteria bacterium]